MPAQPRARLSHAQALMAVLVCAATLALLPAVSSAASLPWPGVAALPAPLDAGPSASVAQNNLGCYSSVSCFAVGQYTSQSGVEQAEVTAETSGSWGQAVAIAAPANALANPTAGLNGVSCIGTGDCAAVGSYIDNHRLRQPMVATETGGSGAWSQAFEVAAPANASTTRPDASLSAISCPSLGVCVAVGSYRDASGNQQAMVAAASGGSWGQAIELTPPANAAADPNASLSGVGCAAAGFCVVAGTYSTSSSRQAMAYTESASVWATPIVITSPTTAAADPNVSIDGLSCDSYASCVAVGSYDDTSFQRRALAVTQTGASTWSQAVEVTAPANGSTDPASHLYGVHCPGSGACTAVGRYTDAGGHIQAMVAHETAGSWGAATEITPPGNAQADPSAQLNGIVCSTLSSCQAVGAYSETGGDSQAMLAVETTGAWAHATQLTPPSDAGAFGAVSTASISCPGAGSCTAAGWYANSSGNTELMVDAQSAGIYGHGQPVPAPVNAAPDPQAGFYGISCPTPGFCAAAGFYRDTTLSFNALAATQSNGAWSQASEVAAPANADASPSAYFNAISCDSPGSCVAVGVYSDNAHVSQGMVATAAGGTWHQAIEVTPPANAATNAYLHLTGVSCTGPGACVAVGYYDDTNSHEQPLYAAESGGSWGRAVELNQPPSGRNGWLKSISCTAAGWCDAVGAFDDSTNQRYAMSVVERNGSWSPAVRVLEPAGAPLSTHAELVAVSCTAPGSCVGAGYSYDTLGDQQAMIATESQGVWSAGLAVSAPADASPDPISNLAGISCPTTGNCGSAGTYANGNGNTTVAMATSGPDPIAIGTAALPAASVGSHYSTQLAVTGGGGHVAFTITSGALPAGLALAASGAISGTPTRTGTAQFTVTANDAGPPSQSQAATFVINVTGGGAGRAVVRLRRVIIPIKRGKAIVTIDCSHANCVGVLELARRMRIRIHHGHHTTYRVRVIILARGSFSLVPGHAASFKLTLTRAGAIAFVDARRHPVRCQLIIALAGTPAFTLRVTVR